MLGWNADERLWERYIGLGILLGFLFLGVLGLRDFH